jgi:ATP-dependent 26S proteasome regulatory subunit
VNREASDFSLGSRHKGLILLQLRGDLIGKKVGELILSLSILAFGLWFLVNILMPGLSIVFEFINSMAYRILDIDNPGLIFFGLACSVIIGYVILASRQPTTLKYVTGSDTKTAIKPQLNIADPTAFDRLIGLHTAKQEVQDFFDIMNAFSTDPELAKRYELKPPKGLLLYGPPGNGKTSFARACAKYYGFAFINIKGSELVAGDGAVGIPQQKIKDLFNLARQQAPSIIFFDEIDAISQTRSGRSINSPSDILLDSLLNEIDGFNPLKGVYIMAATNRKDILDPALIRPGRLEKHIEIGNPSFQDRIDILVAHLGKKPVEKNIDLYLLASLTEGRSGAYLEAIVNRANTVAFRDRRTITHSDLETAIKEFDST